VEKFQAADSWLTPDATACNQEQSAMMNSKLIWGIVLAVLAGGLGASQMAKADRSTFDRILLAESAGLDKIVSLTFKRIPLQDALTEIAMLADLKLEIDGDALKFKGLTKNMPVTIDIKDAKLSDALRKVLDISSMKNLDYELRDEGKTLFVSTKEALKKPK
jgi:hypothetical protein